jgi:hypothetical protein
LSERSNLINGLLGRPWKANARGPDAFDCWHLAVWIETNLFRRDLPDVSVPQDPSWAWMIRAISTHPERGNWRSVPFDAMGLVTAGDGALVLMARSDRPAHIGVWLKGERRVIHADPNFGVVCDKLLDLRTKGWAKLRFFEPVKL